MAAGGISDESGAVQFLDSAQEPKERRNLRLSTIRQNSVAEHIVCGSLTATTCTIQIMATRTHLTSLSLLPLAHSQRHSFSRLRHDPHLISLRAPHLLHSRCIARVSRSITLELLQLVIAGLEGELGEGHGKHDPNLDRRQLLANTAPRRLAERYPCALNGLAIQEALRSEVEWICQMSVSM